MDSSRKKEMLHAYKQRKIEGGVYALRCTATRRCMIDMTTDLAGAKNRFAFSANSNLCPHHLLQADWRTHGADGFRFEVLETLPKKEEESLWDYKESLALLCTMLRDKTPADELY